MGHDRVGEGDADASPFEFFDFNFLCTGLGGCGVDGPTFDGESGVRIPPVAGNLLTDPFGEGNMLSDYTQFHFDHDVTFEIAKKFVDLKEQTFVPDVVAFLFDNVTVAQLQ